MTSLLRWSSPLWALVISAAALAADPPAGGSASGAKPAEQARRTVDGFLDYLRTKSGLPADRLQKVIELVSTLQADDDARSFAITEGLREVNPEFQAALAALGEEQLDKAIGGFRALRDSDNPYLAAEATYYLARAQILDERFEDAVPLLGELLGKWTDKSLRGGESLFLTGVAEAQLLRRKEAMEALSRFLEKYPDAPERMRVGAFRQLELLKLYEDGTLSDAQLRMEFSRRKLSLEDTGTTTRDQQTKIIDILAKLIKEAEDREAQGQGQGQGSGKQQKSQGQSGEGQSDGQGQGESQGGNSGGGSKGIDSDTARRLHRGGPQSPWSKLRDKDRDPVFNALKEKFPGRYQQLIEQYYKSFQDEDEG